MSASQIKLSLLWPITLMMAGACKPPTAPPALPSLPEAPALTAGPPAGSSVERAQAVTDIDLGHCFAVASHQAQPDEARCPAFISEAVAGGMQTCGEVGGKLAPSASPSAWSIDFNGDRQPEYLFEFSANVWCDVAPSIFSCGSLGCPVGIFERRDGAWRIIGTVGEGTPDSLEILPGEGKSGFRDFRTGCIDAGPCPEYAHYRWTGNGYEVTKLDVRGFDVDLSGPVHGLANIPAGTAVLATPQPDGEMLDRYAEGAEVVVIGQAGDYYYVSPCNACKSGFALKSAVSPLKF